MLILPRANNVSSKKIFFLGFQSWTSKNIYFTLERLIILRRSTDSVKNYFTNVQFVGQGEHVGDRRQCKILLL